ncbi:MAG TPA: L-threonylcarbamoyladenylate synthase, partial [Polyangia bacterium]|nr:L-threonylcarbamoyladenylate synthase [Polyangia bacterium]
MSRPPAEELAVAVVALRRGEIVAYPTETFYGLAVDASDELALARLRELKGRAEKAFSVLVVGPEMLAGLVEPPPEKARALMERYWPGALTLALPARAGVPAALVADGCVAVRESPHPLARALVRAFGGPITATSANLAGAPPATTPDEVAAG